ncbi:hypothetical protein F5887DRAFT_919199 [Amanita rubescens]|nr:hypothetical protein F5887DRAFT_919199 [Amanita rubescens]
MSSVACKPLMPPRQKTQKTRKTRKTRGQTPGTPPGGEQEDGNAKETRPYGFRESTLIARSAEPGQLNPTQNRPNSRSQNAVDKTSKDFVKGVAQQLQETDGDSAPSMPPVSKSKNMSSSDNSVNAGSRYLPFHETLTHRKKAIGLGNPSTRGDVETVRTASGGIKRNREGVSDVDDTAPARKLMRSVSRTGSDEETNSLRQSVSGTNIGWHANPISSSSQSQEPEGDHPHEDSDTEGKSSSSESDTDGYASDPNHGVVIRPKEGLPAAAKTQRGATKPRQSNQDSQNDASATEHSPSNSEAAVHDSHQPAPAAPPAAPPVAPPVAPPAAPESPQGASAAMRVRGGGGPAQRPVGYYGRSARAKRRQEQRAQSQPNRPSGDETGRSGGNKTHWTINDLPPDTDLHKWNVFVVPRFLKHFACYGEPWDANAYLEIAQALWKDIFPRSKHVPAQKDDAVYPLIHFAIL